MFDLSGKVSVIFGGCGTIGKEFMKSLIEHNSKVVCCDLFIPEEVEKVKGVDYVKTDAADPEVLENLKNEIVDKYGSVDVLITSTTAKSNDFYLPFDEVSLEGWNIGLVGNLTVPFLVCQKFIRQMIKQGKGSIINISSVYGLVGNDQGIYEGSNLHEIYVKDSPNIKQVYSHGVYNAAKAGIINFSRYLAAYYGKDGIRVNCISPGGIKYPKENDTFLKKYGAKVPLGRKAEAHEMNGALIYLASDASSYVTGENIVVDGGFTCW